MIRQSFVSYFISSYFLQFSPVGLVLQFWLSFNKQNVEKHFTLIDWFLLWGFYLSFISGNVISPVRFLQQSPDLGLTIGIPGSGWDCSHGPMLRGNAGVWKEFWAGFSIPPSSSWILAGCPNIPLNSDAIYLEIMSDPTDEGTVPQDCSTLDANCKPKLSLVLLKDWLYTRGCHNPLLAVLINFLEQFTGLGNQFTH